jgi:UDPglucose 6-dehydrogenase
MDGYKVVVTKSTVPVGTAKKVRKWIQEELNKRGSSAHFSVASNPEFLREGAAIGDFMRPDRVVIGTDDGDEQALAIIQDLYRPLFLNETPFVLTNVATAELSKYAANAFLATKISFINEISILCERIGGDVQGVARAMGLDKRIGSKFLHAGPGYGGSCFPKDTLSAVHFARDLGIDFEIVEAAIRANTRQREHVTNKVRTALGGDVKGKTVSLLGLSFKPETDDVRDSPAIAIARSLVAEGATVRAFDPQAMNEAARAIPELVLCKDVYETCEGGDVLVIATEWNQFRMLDFARVKDLLNEPIMVDLRNIYRADAMNSAGFSYLSVGR